MPRRSVLKPQIWQLPSFRNTVRHFDTCRDLADTNRPLSVVTAAAGDGKTFCAEWYAHNHRGVRHAFCPPRDILTPRSLLEELCRALGIAPVGTRLAQLFELITATVLADKAYLIIDEADRLRASNIDLLRDLAEQASCPLTFLGCPGLLVTMEYAPAAVHRVGFRYTMPACRAEHVHKLFDTQFGPDVTSRLYERTRGNLRHLEGLVALLAHVRDGDQAATLSPDDVDLIADNYLLTKAVAA